MDYRIERYRDIEVCWLQELDGGGRAFGQDFLPIVRNLFGRVGRLFEFCAGPGFIGFSLLAHGLCDSLVLADINPLAIDALQETVRRNDLGDRVAVYHSDGLARIPDDERWNLVVGNPPHYASPPGYVKPGNKSASLRTVDAGWRLHASFYAEVGRFLADGGQVLLLDNSKGGSPDDFLPMLRAGGLELVRTLWYSASGHHQMYYLWSKKLLSGLILEPPTISVYDIELTEPPSTSVTEIENADVFRLRLHNKLTRAVRPRLLAIQRYDVFDAIAPQGVYSLPPLAFRAGRYGIDDHSTNGDGGWLATIDVAPHD
jgi:hypothetical protein